MRTSLVQRDKASRQLEMSLVQQDVTFCQWKMRLFPYDMRLFPYDKTPGQRKKTLVQEDETHRQGKTSPVQQDETLRHEKTSLRQQDATLNRLAETRGQGETMRGRQEKRLFEKRSGFFRRTRSSFENPDRLCGTPIRSASGARRSSPKASCAGAANVYPADVWRAR
jgi:hypothetical protein